MAIDNTKFYPGDSVTIEIYNGQAIIDYSAEFIFDDDESAYPFNGYASGFFYVYNSREQKKIKSFTTQVSRNSNFLVLNLSELDCTFQSRGKYYFEFGYVRSGGYEITLRFGELIVR